MSNLERIQYQQNWRLKNKEKRKSYYVNNKEKLSNQQKIKYANNKDTILKKSKQYREFNNVRINQLRKIRRERYKEKIKIQKHNSYVRHKENINIKNNIYSKTHRDSINKNKRKYIKYRLKTDIGFKLIRNLRNRLWYAIRGKRKVGSAAQDLGCSIDYLKKYIESKFTSGMTWKNYGVKGWHLDHIVPLSAFNLMNREEFLKAFHYNNLQPLWAIDNIKKSNKLSL